MAEFITRRAEADEYGPDEGFNAMGKPVPFYRQQEAYNHAIEMGLDKAAAHAVVSGMSEQLARDRPYDAMASGMGRLDLTGTYRLMAVLLTAPNPDAQA